MKTEGMLAIGGGSLAVLYAGFVQRVSVEGGYGGREILNLGLQQDRLLVFAFGLTLLIVGILLLIGDRIESALQAGAKNAFNPNAGSSIVHIEVETEPDQIRAASDAERSPSIEAEMDTLGVSRDGEFYVFGTYRSERLEDALAYARAQHAK